MLTQENDIWLHNTFIPEQRSHFESSGLSGAINHIVQCYQEDYELKRANLKKV